MYSNVETMVENISLITKSKTRTLIRKSELILLNRKRVTS